MNRRDRLDALAAALAYPGEGSPAALERCRACLQDGPPEALAEFDCFLADQQPRSVEERQEAYTRTFDLDAACSLEVGWHLFGENYSRGEFLVAMRRDLRAMGLPETGELPDHLVHVLPVLGRMEPARAGTFAALTLLPALSKMLEALEGREGGYAGLVRAVRHVVRQIASEAPKEALRG